MSSWINVLLNTRGCPPVYAQKGIKDPALVLPLTGRGKYLPIYTRAERLEQINDQSVFINKVAINCSRESMQLVVIFECFKDRK